MWREYEDTIRAALEPDENYDDVICALNIMVEARAKHNKRPVSDSDKQTILTISCCLAPPGVPRKPASFVSVMREFRRTYIRGIRSSEPMQRTLSAMIPVKLLEIEMTDLDFSEIGKYVLLPRRGVPVSAFVLVECANLAMDVVKSLSKIKGVKLACAVAGPYDVIAFVEASDINALNNTILAKVQSLPGVLRTTTNIIAIK
jgi:DNA-binding Lrp family transcriptional regulator